MDKSTICDMEKLLEYADSDGIILYRLKPEGVGAWRVITNSKISDELRRFDYMAYGDYAIIYDKGKVCAYDEEKNIVFPEFFKKAKIECKGFDPYVQFNKFRHNPKYNVKYAILHTGKIYDESGELVYNVH